LAEERDDLPTHLELIQGVIERHARSSFLLKGWSVTLVAAVFLLAVRGTSSVLAMAAGLLPSITFWGLDAYYLMHERTYRALYDHVRKNGTKADDRFTMDARPFKAGVPSWASALCSPSVFWFHAAVVLVVIGALTFFTLRPGHAA
jgi:hypothetical protein